MVLVPTENQGVVLQSGREEKTGNFSSSFVSDCRTRIKSILFRGIVNIHGDS